MTVDRRLLALLVTSAMLTTGIQPFAATDEAIESSRISAAIERKESVSAGAAPARGVAIRVTLEDRALTDDIFVRLSRRHTGLSEDERFRLAQSIVSEARAQDLDPDLVIAVIEVESAGYPLAVSHVGALGLMQLLPSTAEELAGRLGIEWMGDDTLFDPFVNIKLGTAYLRYLADRYGDDVNLALAAYNWGPGRIDRRIRSGSTIPSRYIQQVMRFYDPSAALGSRRS